MAVILRIARDHHVHIEFGSSHGQVAHLTMQPEQAPVLDVGHPKTIQHSKFYLDSGLALDGFQVFIDHEMNQFLKGDGGFPSELS